MFTLKFFRRNDNPATLAYRAVATTSFEVFPLENDPEHFVRIDTVGVEGETVEHFVKNGEFVYVENAAGKTIDNIRRMVPYKENAT